LNPTSTLRHHHIDLIPSLTLHCTSQLTIPSINRTLWLFTWVFIGIIIGNQFRDRTDPDSPWMLRNFLSSLSSSPAVKMPLKAPPKPTVPAAIKSAENATPSEGGEYIILRYRPVLTSSGARYICFWMLRKSTVQIARLCLPLFSYIWRVITIADILVGN